MCVARRRAYIVAVEEATASVLGRASTHSTQFVKHMHLIGAGFLIYMYRFLNYF